MDSGISSILMCTKCGKKFSVDSSSEEENEESTELYWDEFVENLEI